MSAMSGQWQWSSVMARLNSAKAEMHCSDNTATKMKHYEIIIRFHMGIVANVLSQGWSHPDYHYVDCHAGSGLYDVPGVRGSPRIFCEAAQLKKLSAACWFVEKDLLKAALLRQTLADRPGVKVVHNRFERVLPGLSFGSTSEPAMGLVFADPAGTLSDAQVSEFKAFFARHHKMDFLLHVAAGAYKRARLHGYDFRAFVSNLRSMKKYWSIRQKSANLHWTFLIGSDWKEMPRKLRSIYFRDLDSVEGLTILAELSTPGDRRHRRPVNAQGDLFA